MYIVDMMMPTNSKLDTHVVIDNTYADQYCTCFGKKHSLNLMSLKNLAQSFLHDEKRALHVFNSISSSLVFRF